MTYLGIDIGGTTAKLGIVTDDGTILARTAVATAGLQDGAAIVDAILCAATPLVEAHRPAAVGIGSAGRIDVKNGVVLRAGNLPFQNEPLCAKVSAALHLPTFLDNDANCALLAEATCGVCTDCRDALMVTLGTGVGGAILIDGTLYRAHNYRAGEFGHFVFDKDGPPCVCGLRGCFEHYASATALVKAAKAAAEEHPDSRLAAAEPQSAKAVFDAAEDGCPVAEDVLAAYGETLALGLNSLLKIFMPQCIVLAGGVANAGDALLRRTTPHLLPEAELRLSSFASDAGLIGAAMLAKIQ